MTAAGATTDDGPVTAARTEFRLLLRVPDRVDRAGDNADLAIQPAEQVVAEAQASQFSQVCNVWAPMYRQATDAALNDGDSSAPRHRHRLRQPAVGVEGLPGPRQRRPARHLHRALAGRGHADQAAASQVDPSPKLRKQMVSAIILGGNVQVPTRARRRGSFRHIPTCTSASQTGCVIAYSSFGSTPPARSLFGRPGQGVSLQSGQTATKGQQVACVNPATFSRRPASCSLCSRRPAPRCPASRSSTPWVSFPACTRPSAGESAAPPGCRSPRRRPVTRAR